MAVYKIEKTHYMHAWNDFSLQWIAEVHMKNVKWELCSVLEERKGGGVSELAGDWGSFLSTPFLSACIETATSQCLDISRMD